jgi:DNA polymerase I
VHLHTTSLLFDTPLEQVTDRERQVGKKVNFSVIYGMAAKGLAEELGCDCDEAQRHIDRCAEEYPEINGWKEHVLDEARQAGYVTTKYGRQRLLENLNSDDIAARSRAKRQAVNTVVQGTAADIFKLALVRVYHELPGCRLLLPNHDVLLLEVPTANVKKARRKLKDIMQVAPPGFQKPLVVEVKSGTTFEAVLFPAE